MAKVIDMNSRRKIAKLVKWKTHTGIPRQDNVRDMWLLTGLGVVGRIVVEIEQYEELRKLAIKLAKRVDKRNDSLLKLLKRLGELEAEL